MLTCYFEDGGKALLRHVTLSAIIVHDEKILMVKRAPFLSEPNKYGLPGGYLDRDETTSQGAAREVLEETGYEVTSMQLFRIIDHPDRPREDKQNIEFCFLAQVGKQTGKPDHEVTELVWFPLTALPPAKQIAFDHFENIQLYLQYQQERLPLPLYDKHI